MHFKTYMEKQPVNSYCKDMFSVGGHFSFPIEATLTHILNDYQSFQIMYGLSSSKIPAYEKADNICLFGAMFNYVWHCQPYWNFDSHKNVLRKHHQMNIYLQVQSF